MGCRDGRTALYYITLNHELLLARTLSSVLDLTHDYTWLTDGLQHDSICLQHVTPADDFMPPM